MRYLAVDLGTRRVGLATGDDEVGIATPLHVLDVNGMDGALEPVRKLAAEEGCDAVVIGLPLNMADGTVGPAAKGVIAWAKQLNFNVLFVDERLSSFVAEQQLIARKRGGEKMTRLDKRRRLDALAAAAILQAMFEGEATALTLETVELALAARGDPTRQ